MAAWFLVSREPVVGKADLWALLEPQCVGGRKDLRPEQRTDHTRKDHDSAQWFREATRTHTNQTANWEWKYRAALSAVHEIGDLLGGEEMALDLREGPQIPSRKHSENREEDTNQSKDGCDGGNR